MFLIQIQTFSVKNILKNKVNQMWVRFNDLQRDGVLLFNPNFAINKSQSSLYLLKEIMSAIFLYKN